MGGTSPIDLATTGLNQAQGMAEREAAYARRQRELARRETARRRQHALTRAERERELADSQARTRAGAAARGLSAGGAVATALQAGQRSDAARAQHRDNRALQQDLAGLADQRRSARADHSRERLNDMVSMGGSLLRATGGGAGSAVRPRRRLTR